jgi:hypothetical protein
MTHSLNQPLAPLRAPVEDEFKLSDGGAETEASSRLIPAAKFAAAVGRGLRTLTNWDLAGVIHPVIKRRRRYYRLADIIALASEETGPLGPRAGSRIKYLISDNDNVT